VSAKVHLGHLGENPECLGHYSTKAVLSAPAVSKQVSYRTEICKDFCRISHKKSLTDSEWGV